VAAAKGALGLAGAEQGLRRLYKCAFSQRGKMAECRRTRGSQQQGF